MRIAVAIFLVLLPLIAQGEVYRWVDENGQVHYGSIPPGVQKPYKPGDLIEEDKNNSTENTGASDQKNHFSEKKKNEATRNETVKNDPKQDGDKPEPGITNKIKTAKEIQEERSRAKEQEKIRKEKFDNLIKRLKMDLSVLPVKETAIPNKGEIQKDGNHQKSESVKVSSDKLPVKEKSSKNKELRKSNITDRGDKQKKEEEKEIRKEIESVEQATHKDTNEDKCGFFMSFVDNYKDRIKYECPSDHCDLLKKKLAKYQNKAKQYCGNDMETAKPDKTR